MFPVVSPNNLKKQVRYVGLFYFMHNLTARQILEAFPDECKYYVPRVINKIEWYMINEINIINHSAFDERSKAFLKEVLKVNSQSQLDHLKELKQIKYLMKEGTENRIDIDRIKAIPILQLHPFSKVIKKGKRIWASCPFHEDNTPSFLIDVNNRFHCFSCQAGGSTIDFIMKLHNLSFRKALEYGERI